MVGRCANRIFGSKFSIDGKEYNLSENIPDASLHGGHRGFSFHLHKSEVFETSEGVSLKLIRISPDGEEGFPGTLKLEVIYTVTNDNTLKIEYYATTDAPTIVNFTNHSYFNLNGTGCPSVDNHQLWVNADNYTPSSKNLQPSGEIDSVLGTVLDLTKPKMLKECLEDLQPGGFDHNYVLNPECKVVVYNMNLNENPIEVLKIVQLAIASVSKDIPFSNRDGSDMYKLKKKKFYKLAEESLNDKIPVIFGMSNIEFLDYLWENIEKLKSTLPPAKGAPNREFMPQTSKADGYDAKLQSGEVNYKPPFVKEDLSTNIKFDEFNNDSSSS
jgi:hypothetical protein